MTDYPSKFAVGDILIETPTKKSLKVVKLVGSSQVELQDLAVTNKYDSDVVDLSYLVRGVANGSIKRIS